MRKNLIPLGGLALAIALVLLSVDAKASAGDSNLGDITTDKSPPGETSLLALCAGSTTELVDKMPSVTIKGYAITEEAVNPEAAKLAENYQEVAHEAATKVFASFATNNLSPRRMSAGDLSELGSVLRL